MIYSSLEKYKKKIPIIIIGSGPASISLVLSLEKKINTLIIEAGNFEFDPNLQNTFDATNSGDFNFDLTINRIKQFGGTSNV